MSVVTKIKEEKKAVAYLNVSVIDKSGEMHKLKFGIALFEGNSDLETALLAKLASGAVEVNCVGTLNSAEKLLGKTIIEL